MNESSGAGLYLHPGSEQKSDIATEVTRCQHRFEKGARCRLTAAPNDVFCLRHRKIRAADDVSATLTTGLDDLKSPAAIHDLLSRLLLLLAQDLISPRRAAVLFYGSGLLLRATAAMEADAEKNQSPVKYEYIIDIPRPGWTDEQNADWEARRALGLTRGISCVAIPASAAAESPSAAS